jgi:hypothetical protein
MAILIGAIRFRREAIPVLATAVDAVIRIDAMLGVMDQDRAVR